MTGVAAEYLRSQLDTDMTGPLPWFEVGDPDPRVQVLPATPVLVLLGTTIRDTELPRLEWHDRWNRYHPARRWFSGIPPSGQEYEYPPRVRRAFAERAQKLIETQSRAGARRKTSVPELQALVQEHREKHRGNDPTQQLADRAGVHEDTVHSTYERAGIASSYQEFLDTVPVRKQKARTVTRSR